MYNNNLGSELGLKEANWSEDGSQLGLLSPGI